MLTRSGVTGLADLIWVKWSRPEKIQIAKDRRDTLTPFGRG